MTQPLRAVTTDEGRYYPLDGKRYVSVTTVIGNLPKPHLVQWSATKAADMAVKLAKVGNVDRDACRFAWMGERDEAGRLGNATHEHAEYLVANQGDYDPAEYLESIQDKKIRSRVGQFLRFLEDYEVVPVHVEATVFSRHGYAGSCDLMAYVDGVLTIIDLKTSKSVYGSVALQLAAYANADFIITDDGERLDVPQFKRAAVLHVRPRGYKYLRVNALNPVVIDTFLALLDIKHHWLDDLDEKVIGSTIRPRRS